MQLNYTTLWIYCTTQSYYRVLYDVPHYIFYLYRPYSSIECDRILEACILRLPFHDNVKSVITGHDTICSYYRFLSILEYLNLLEQDLNTIVYSGLEITPYRYVLCSFAMRTL